SGMDERGDGIIDVGPIPSSTNKGCTACKRPMSVTFNPLVGKLSTGKPDAGNPPVRFGGRGGRNQSAVPTPICLRQIIRNPPATFTTTMRCYDVPPTRV